MGLDVDSVAAKQAIEKLSNILYMMNHGERKDIADDIIAFVEEMEEKYGNDEKNEKKRKKLKREARQKLTKKNSEAGDKYTISFNYVRESQKAILAHKFDDNTNEMFWIPKSIILNQEILDVDKEMDEPIVLLLPKWYYEKQFTFLNNDNEEVPDSNQKEDKDDGDTPLTEELLIEKGFECERERDKDDDKDGIWYKDGLTIYQDFWTGTEFKYATRTQEGEFKAGISVKTLKHLRDLYRPVTNKELD